MIKEIRKPWMLWLLFLVGLLPFIHRPWLFDDPSVLVTARAAARHPLHPYAYVLDLNYPHTANWPAGAIGPAYTHPPLSAWILGGWMHVFGDSEVALHLVMFLLALACLVVAERLIRDLGMDPLPALAGLAFSPVFFLTAFTLYPHVFYVFFYWLTLWLQERLVRDPTVAKALGVGLSLTAAALSLDHWPVLILLCGLLLLRKTPQARAAWRLSVTGFFIFMVCYGSWALWERHLHGITHFQANLAVRARGPYPWQAIFLPLVFLSGTLPLLGISWIFLKQRAAFLFATLLMGGSLAALFFHSGQGGFSAAQSVLLGLELSTGLAFMAALILFVRASTEPLDCLLSVWFGVEFLFVQRFMPWPSAHHLLQLAMPAVLLAYRLALHCEIKTKGWTLAVMASGFLSLALGYADLKTAQIGPQLALDLAAIPAPRYYWGNDFSGFSWYLKQSGWHAYDQRVPLRFGEHLLIAHNLNVQGPPLFLRDQHLVREGQWVYRLNTPLRTVSIEDSAGWYSASWGALPFSLSDAPAEIFSLYSGPQS